MTLTDKRGSLRLDSVKAKFRFDNVDYEISNISQKGMLVRCEKGFDSSTLIQLAKGTFDFSLLDPDTKSEIELEGDLIRSVKDKKSGETTALGIIFKPRQESRSSYSPLENSSAKLIAIGGSKGGVGKTVISVNLALALSQLGKKVILFDGDFGNANCHTLLGMTTVERDIENYLRDNLTLNDVLLETPYPRLSLISGAGNKIEHYLKDVKTWERLKVDILTLDCDYVIIDLGAGFSDETLGLYELANDKIIVVTPQYTSLQNAYSFIKAALYYSWKNDRVAGEFEGEMGDDIMKIKSIVDQSPANSRLRIAYDNVGERQRFQVIANMVNNKEDVEIVKKLKSIVINFLNIQSEVVGLLPESDEIKRSINRITPFSALFPKSASAEQLRKLVGKLERSAPNFET